MSYKPAQLRRLLRVTKRFSQNGNATLTIQNIIIIRHKYSYIHGIKQRLLFDWLVLYVQLKQGKRLISYIIISLWTQNIIILLSIHLAGMKVKPAYSDSHTISDKSVFIRTYKMKIVCQFYYNNLESVCIYKLCSQRTRCIDLIFVRHTCHSYKVKLKHISKFVTRLISCQITHE